MDGVAAGSCPGLPPDSVQFSGGLGRAQTGSQSESYPSVPELLQLGEPPGGQVCPGRGNSQRGREQGRQGFAVPDRRPPLTATPSHRSNYINHAAVYGNRDMLINAARRYHEHTCASSVVVPGNPLQVERPFVRRATLWGQSSDRRVRPSSSASPLAKARSLPPTWPACAFRHHEAWLMLRAQPSDSSLFETSRFTSFPNEFGSF